MSYILKNSERDTSKGEQKYSIDLYVSTDKVVFKLIYLIFSRYARSFKYVNFMHTTNDVTDVLFEYLISQDQNKKRYEKTASRLFYHFTIQQVLSNKAKM